MKVLEKDLKDNKETLAKETKTLKQAQFENVKMSQTTGIVSDEKLSEDFKKRTADIEQLERDIQILKEKHSRLTMDIEQARIIKQRSYANE